MAFYRREWTNKPTGWRLRWDIVPYDQSGGLAGAPTVLDVLTIGDDPTQDHGFDALPVGIETRADVSVSVILDDLPPTLLARLREGADGTGSRNTWVLWSDRGTDGVTWTVEGVYVQTNIEATEYEKIAGKTVAKYTLQDSIAFAMQSVRGSTIGASSLVPITLRDPSETRDDRELWQVIGTDARGAQLTFIKSADVERARASSWEHVGEHMAYALTQWWNLQANRSTNANISYTDFSVSGLELATLLTQAVEYYGTTETGSNPRAQGSALWSDEVLLVTHVYNKDGDPIGGLYHPNDELGFGRYESFYECLKEYAEASAVKVWWSYSYNAGGGSPYLSCYFYARRICTNGYATGGVFSVVAPYTLTRSGAEKVSDGADVIGSAEVRYKTYDERDNTEIRYNNGTTKGQRSYATPAPFVSCPVMLDTADYDARDFWEFRKYGLLQSNLLCYRRGDNRLTKVHETTRVYVDQTNYVEVENTTQPPAPKFKNTGGITTDTDGVTRDVAMAQLEGWVVDQQASSAHAYAVASTLAQLFGKRQQGRVVVTLPIPNANGLTERVGGVFDTDADAVLTHIDFGRAIATNVRVDWKAGTVAYSLLCVPDL